MPSLRSRTVTHGRNMAGARALLRATGVAREDIGKPIIAVANSFTEFVPGHVHLREVGQVVAAACGRPGRFRASSIRSRWTTASPWATAACCTRCPAGS